MSWWVNLRVMTLETMISGVPEQINPSLFEIDFHFSGDCVKQFVEHHVKLRCDLASPQILD